MYYIIVFENFRFCPSTRKREASVFENLHSGKRFKKKAFSVSQTGEKNLRFQTKTDVCGLGPRYHNGNRGENIAWKVNSRFFKVAKVVQCHRPLARGGNLKKRKKCDALVKLSSFACVLLALFPPSVEMLSRILFSRQLYLEWTFHLGVMPDIKFGAHDRLKRFLLKNFGRVAWTPFVMHWSFYGSVLPGDMQM